MIQTTFYVGGNFYSSLFCFYDVCACVIYKLRNSLLLQSHLFNDSLSSLYLLPILKEARTLNTLRVSNNLPSPALNDKDPISPKLQIPYKLYNIRSYTFSKHLLSSSKILHIHTPAPWEFTRLVKCT